MYLFLIFTANFSYAKVTFPSGSSYPAKVDLTEYYYTKNICQIGGTCHIYAQVALLEATCKKRIGESFKISEAYFINRHLSAEIHDQGNDLIRKKVPEDEITPFDGGFPSATAQRALTGSVQSEKDFPTTEITRVQLVGINYRWTRFRRQLITRKVTLDNIYYLEMYLASNAALTPARKQLEKNLAMLKSPRRIDKFGEFVLLQPAFGLSADRDLFDQEKQRDLEMERLKRTSQKLILEYVNSQMGSKERGKMIQFSKRKLVQETQNFLNRQMLKYLPMATPAESGGYSAPVQDPKLKQCLGSKPKLRYISSSEFSVEKAVLLLSRNTPFLCIHDVKDGERHVYNVIGYKFSSKAKPRISFLVKDSAGEGPAFEALNCDQVEYYL